MAKKGEKRLSRRILAANIAFLHLFVLIYAAKMENKTENNLQQNIEHKNLAASLFRYFSLILYLALGGSFYVYLASAQVPRAAFSEWLLFWLILWVWAAIGWLAVLKYRYWPWAWIAVGAVFWRLAWGNSLPILSDDFWRFLIDGRLWAAGVNPFLYTPEQLISAPIAATTNLNLEELYTGCNSKNYYSVYPLFSQIWFRAAATVGQGDLHLEVFALRAMLFIADAFAILGLSRLLRQIGQPPAYALFYALAPFTIIEGAGNLHFETAQLAFLIWSLLAYMQQKYNRAALLFAAAAACKLLPLLILPILVFRLPTWRARFQFSAIVGVLIPLSFAPFLSLEVVQNIGQSLHLYVGVFEFNASIYYILRAFGFWLYDMNMIATWGKFLSIFVLAAVLFVAIFRQSWTVFEQALAAFALYFACATTVHPWYIGNILLLSLLTRFRFLGLTWAFLSFFSYHAYSGDGEKIVFLLAEYGLLLLAALLCFLRSKTVKSEDDTSTKS